MTRHEVEKEMMQYRTIFPIVRLLDAGQVCGNARWRGIAPAMNYGIRMIPARTASPVR